MTAELAQTAEGQLSLGELEESLGFLLRVAQVRAFDRFYASFGAADLRPGEFSALWVIRRNPGVRQGVVAEALRIKPAHMTKMIRRIEDKGQLRRVIPENDRRSVRLFITPAGEQFLEDNRAAFLGQDDYHQHGLSPDEARDLARLLRRYAGLEAG